MKMVAMKTLILLAGAPLLAAETPLSKVVSLLQGMRQKAATQAQSEQVQYAAYKQYCDDTLIAQKAAIQEAQQSMSLLQADIQLGTANAATDDAAVKSLGDSIDGWNKEVTAADAARASEAAEAKAADKIYSDAISAIDQAIEVLKTKNGTLAAAALIEKLESVKVADVPKVVSALVATKPVLLQQGAPSYGKIIGMLYQLRAKFVAEKNVLDKADLSKNQAHLLQVQGLKAAIASAQAQQSAKVQDKAKSQQDLSLLASKSADVQRTLGDQQQAVKDLTTNCQLRASDYASRQETLRKELAAIEQALYLLTGQRVQSVDAKVAKATSLLAIRTVTVRPEQQKVAAFLHSEAVKLQSRDLAQLAKEAAVDPFSQVKDLIQALITKLQLDGKQSGSNRTEWCSNETAASTQAISTRNSSVQQLSTELDGLNSGVAKLNLDIAALVKQQADNQKSLAEQLKLRTAEKALNAATIEDAKAAEAAIAQAIVVLKAFYDAAGSPASLLQGGQKVPTVASGAYSPMVSDGKQVITLLEQIQATYARLESSTTAVEATAQQAVDKSNADINALQKQLDSDIQRLTTEKATKAQAALDKKRDLDGSQKELTAAVAYSQKLQVSCSSPTTSSDQKRIDAEIAALQQAQRLLSV